MARRRGRQHRSARPCSRPPTAARKVTIHKDKIAAVYEYTGGNKQSFFHKRVDPIRGFQAWFLGAVYRAPGSFKQRPNALSQQILAHPNIRVEHMRKRFDHSKLYIIDDRYLALGSMGIGDNHRHDWIDVMVEVEGARARRSACASGWPGSTSSIRRAASTSSSTAARRTARRAAR